VTPGASVDVLVTDHGIAVNPARQDLIDNLRNAGIPLMTIEELQQRAELLTGKPDRSPSPIGWWPWCAIATVQ
jgi:citrate lyase subunit alpha/citrate CoA-transferase